MRQKLLFALSIAIVAPLAAAPARKAAPKITPKPPAEAKLIQSCDAHKFEAVVDTLVNGQTHKSKVRLCGVEGQSDAEWIVTLKDAISKVQANKDMAPATREQIVAAINAEIVRLSIIGTPAPAKRQAQEQPLAPLSRDYATLPPMPDQPKSAESREPAATMQKIEPPALVSAQPAPQPVPAIPSSPSTAVVSPPAQRTVAAPRFAISCESPIDVGGPSACAEVVRDTRLTITADRDVPTGMSLQFVRNGQPRGSIALDGLRGRGGMRTGLPPAVCAGFGSGRIELQFVEPGGAVAVQSEGPFPLRC